MELTTGQKGLRCAGRQVNDSVSPTFSIFTGSLGMLADQFRASENNGKKPGNNTPNNRGGGETFLNHQLTSSRKQST